MSLFEKLKIMAAKRAERNRENDLIQMQQPALDDWETRDKSLKSLRRLRRRQIDELERKQLNKQIAEHNKERDKEGFYGQSSFNKGKRAKKGNNRLFGGSCGFLGKGRI